MTELQLQKRGNSIRFFVMVTMLILFITMSFMVVLPVLSNTVTKATAIPKTLNTRAK